MTNIVRFMDTSMCTNKLQKRNATRSPSTSPEDATGSPPRHANWPQEQGTKYLHCLESSTTAQNKGRVDQRKPMPLTWGMAERSLHLSHGRNVDPSSWTLDVKARLSSAVNELSNGLKRDCCVAPMPSPPKPAKCFDSGDMVMVARLLAHPESSLKVH